MMFQGQSTFEAYEQCLSVGLCRQHLQELNEDLNTNDPHELQRKALLYIRLRILDPLLFGKPYVFDRMKMLISRSGLFKNDPTANAELAGSNSWHQSILLLDSIVVFTLCVFSQVCCCGCLFLTSQESKSSHPEADFIRKLLNSKNVTESDISHFNPLLQEKFKGHDIGLIKYCYVVALLFVRNVTVRIKLNHALAELSVELQSISKESEKWIEIGSDAYKKKSHEEAIEAYTCALKYNPYCVSALSQRAQVYLEMEKFQQAQLDSYVALMIDPKQCLAYITLSPLTKQRPISEGQKVVQYGLHNCNQSDTHECKKPAELGKQAKNGDIKEKKSSNKEANMSDAGNILKKEFAIDMDPPDLEDPDSETEDVPDLSDASSKSVCSGSDSEEENELSNKKSEGIVNQPPVLEDNQSSIEISEKVTAPPLLENRHPTLKCLTEATCAKPISLIKKEKSVGLNNAECQENGPSSEKSSGNNSSNLTADDIEGARIAVENISLKQQLTEIKKEKTERLNNTNCAKKELSSGKRSRKYSRSLMAGNIEGGKTIAEDISPKQELSGEERKQKHKELFLNLKEGSQTVLDGCGQLAVRHFDVAFEIIKDFPSVCQFDEWELVCIKYAYGFAYCTSGGFEDLQKSIAVFKEIIDNYPNVSFPAVYYGIGLSFYKLNRFKDALTYLKTVEDILVKGIHFKVYAWPGLSIVINETKFNPLKYLVENLIKDCEAPPPPDAICRLKECSYQPSIYFSDPDFKGFYCLQCSDHCSLQYHPHCWKILRNYKQCTDKEFLTQNCLTPDCDGVIIKVESINKEGIMEKMFGTAQAKKTTKQKRMKSSKKPDLREEKKKKRQNSRDMEADKNRGLLEHSSVSSSELSESPINDSALKECYTLKSETESVASSQLKEPNTPSNNYTSLSVNAEPYIMIKKEKVDSENTTKIMPKVKDLKKAKDSTITFEEFCNKNGIYSNECREIIVAQQKNQCIMEDEWPTIQETNMHPVVSSYIENTVTTVTTTNQLFEQEDSFDEINDLEAIKSNLYNYMEDFLNRKGPLSIKNSRLIDELESFPTEANIVIARCGGIANFLKEDTEYRFGIVDNLFICSRNDLADAYKLSRSSGIIGSDNLDLLEEFEAQNLEIKTCNSSEISLNPEAKEYTPSHSSSSHNSMTSFTEECCVESKAEMTLHTSSLINAISKLREPICVDNDNFKNDIQSSDPVNSSHRKNSSTNLIPRSLIESFAVKEQTDNEGIHLSEKCIEGINLYFREEMISQRAYIDSCIRPYSIVHISDKTDQNLQTDDLQFDDESKGKKTRELLQLKEIIDALTIEKRELLVQKTLAETKLESELDSVTQHKKQAAIEIENLKRELEDVSQSLEAQKKEFKNKQLALEKENSVLTENLKKTSEENVYLNKEVANIRSRMESIMESLQKFEESMQCVERENMLLKKTRDQHTIKHAEIAKNFECEKLQLTKRVRDAELRFLKMKKESIFQKIDSRTYEAAQNMKSVDSFLQSPLSSSIPLFKNSLEALLKQIQICISKLTEIRLNFQSRIDEQINAVNNNNISLETLAPIEVNTLPEIPSLENILKISNPGNTQNAKQNAQMINLWNSACNFPSNQIGATNESFHSNPMFVPSQTTSFPQYQKVPNNTAKQNMQTSCDITKKTKLPPGIKNVTMATSESSDCLTKEDKCKVSNATSVLIPTSSAKKIVPNDSSVACSSQEENNKPEVSSTNQSLEKPIVRTISRTSLASSSSTIDVDLSNNCDNSTLELGYNVKENESSKTNPLPVGSVKPKCTYEKLLRKLKSKYPSYNEDDLTQYIKRFRDSRESSLSGLAIDYIISNVSDLIESEKTSTTTIQIGKNAAPNTNNSKQSKVLKNKKMTLNLKEEKPQKQPPQKPCPWGHTDNDSKSNWSGNNVSGEECIICYSEMTVTSAYRVDCGHCFHLSCIRAWLNKKSDCPICRVHLLLPEDYPALS